MSAEGRVGDWLIAYLRADWSQTRLTRALAAHVWDATGVTTAIWEARSDQLGHVLVQLREAWLDAEETEPGECGATIAVARESCDSLELCGVHGTAVRRRWDMLATFVAEVVVAVPIRARAKVEAMKEAR